MRSAALVLVALAGLPLTLHADGKRPMTPRDVIEIRQVSDPQISPDATRIAFVVAERDTKENLYQTDLWVVGASEGEPLRLTRHPKNDRTPRWSPDGTRLAFLSEREEKPQVFLMDARGGEPWALTEVKAGVQAFAWSPDGKTIAYLATDAPSDEQEKKTKEKQDELVVDGDLKMSHLWAIEVEARKARRLTEGAFTLADPQFSPDGSEIALVRRPTPKADDADRADVVIVPLAGGAPRVLFENKGEDSSPRWSPDGKRIAFLSREAALPALGNPSLVVVPSSGGAPRRLTDGELGPTSLSWAADGRSLLFAANRGVRGALFSVASDGGSPQAIVDGPFVASNLSVAAKGGALAYLRSDPQSPIDVWARAPGRAPAQRTHLNPQVAEWKLGSAEAIRWKSADGLEIEGLLWMPPDAKPGAPLPLVVHAHGGPSGAYLMAFPASANNYVHCLAGRGYAVFQPNFRGSSGYGDAFVRLNFKGWGAGDFQDVMTGVDELVRRGVADKDKLVVHGWSYGGYMTAWTITQTDRFKAAVVGAGLTNMVSMYSTNDLQGVIEEYFGGQPWDDYHSYERASAMYHVKKAKTPTLILHGEKDDRVPPSQAQELYMGLKKNGVPVEMVVYPREPHGFREPNHQLDKMEREMAWFNRWLYGEER